MTVTPSEISSTEANLDLANEPAADLDLDIPERGPTADDPASRAVSRDLRAPASRSMSSPPLLSKYDYNFKPGDVVNGTVFAMEPKGRHDRHRRQNGRLHAPAGGSRSNRVEALSDVLQPGEVREFLHHE